MNLGDSPQLEGDVNRATLLQYQLYTAFGFLTSPQEVLFYFVRFSIWEVG
jgi:hypothetical protein